MKTHLISFAEHNDNRYEKRRLNYYENAKEFVIFDTITVLSGKNVFEYCPELISHKNYMISQKSYGFWVWKHFIIREALNSIPENDILLYTDIGCYFNHSARDRMRFYQEQCAEKDSLLFEMSHLPEYMFTKMDTYKKVFPFGDKFLKTPQKVGGIIFIKNTQRNKDIFDELKIIGTEKNYHHLNDNDSIEPNHVEFQSHRHDQSILSLVSKKYHLFSIPDETYFLDWEKDGKPYPIWAKRIVY